MKKFAKFWKAANFRLKFGLIVTLIFFIIGFVVYYVPHANPFTFNTYPNKLGASAEHWLGTTSMGQDVVWLLIEAIHNSLVIGLIVAFLGTVVGVFVGLLSGFAGGLLDRVLMIVTDTFVVIPSLPILIMMTSLMKGSSTTIVMALVLAMFAWAWPSRQIRSMALSIKERDFIHTAKFSGESTGADRRDRDSAVCADLVALQLYERYAFRYRFRVEPCCSGSFPRQPCLPRQHDSVGKKLQRNFQQAVSLDRRTDRCNGYSVCRPVLTHYGL